MDSHAPTQTRGSAGAPAAQPAGVPPFLLKTLITAVIGGFTYVMTNATDQPEVWKLTASIFVGGAAMIIQFMVDFERRLGGVESSLSVHNSEMKDLVAEGFAKINHATELFGLVEGSALRSDGVTRLVRSATVVGSEGPEIMKAFAQSEVNRLATLMANLHQKHADYDGEDHDWIVSLTQCATDTIDATSTSVDHDFWPTELGQRYLRAQRDAIRSRGVRIRRLFIVDTPEEIDDDLGQLVEHQQSLGIQVRVLALSQLPPIAGIDITNDFILFDQSLSYEVEPDLRGMNAKTTMDLREDRVARRIKRFEELWDAGDAEPEPGD
ncbi:MULTISPECIES: DUF6879 family protein [Streptomyces]|uniref:DUF6879 domain-containing protein n=1 Tax=Streptomyces lycii TaxID=2654337 RepID=A0ABQ7FMC2_9ACTN|nr:MULTISPECIES: DUF6879 family protein [Streptomyces]KAF4409980.1 hypothetical protein GCU69_06300 [Streptomyces lycii]PGH50769.1 hypothetical protein CRI70_10215 [Streptomyces sp. Ru87]